MMGGGVGQQMINNIYKNIEAYLKVFLFGFGKLWKNIDDELTKVH